MRYAGGKFCLVLATLLLGSCASLTHPVPIEWEHGAKRGVVLQVLDRPVDETPAPACLAALTQSELQSGRYVRVRYRHVRRYIDDFAMLAAGLVVRKDDLVEFFPANCELGKLGMVRRVLPKSFDE